MTRAAREVLEDCRVAVQQLGGGTQGRAWRIQWVSAVVLLRAVGHVLNSIDGKDPKYASAIADAWDELKHSKPAPAIFWQFIETERNNIVKEYEIGAGQGVTVYLGQTRPADNHYLINVGPYQGREQREVLAEAIAWWEEYLANIDKRAAG